MATSGLIRDIDIVLRKIVDDLWKQYDHDANGQLDLQETTDLVRSFMRLIDEEFECSDHDVQMFFTQLDKDGSGTIEKDEMLVYLRKVAGCR